MTENEAIKELETSIDLAKMCTQNYERKREIQGYEMAIQALEEVQQYRKHGVTVESALNNMCDLAAAENLIEEYRAIGTLEECRAAVEKQTAKRALHQGCYDKNGEWHEWNGINGKPYELCPSCRVNLCCETSLDIKPKYCSNCGQKLDWSDAE